MTRSANTDTNTELGKLTERIDQHHKYNVAEFAEIKRRLDYTNGDIKDLKNWRREREIREEAVEDFKKKNPVSVANAEQVNVSNVLFSDGVQRIFLAIAGLITAVASYVALRGGA